MDLIRNSSSGLPKIFTTETKLNLNTNTNPNRNPTDPTKSYHLTVYDVQWEPENSTWCETLSTGAI